MIASREAKSADEVARHNAMLTRVMVEIAADAWVLSEVVAHGPLHWRRQFLGTMHAAGFPLTDETVADELFAFFCVQVQQRAHSEAPPQQLAGHFLDQLDVETPHIPTEAEIAESWELESASSPDGQAFAYGGKTKDDVMQGLKGELDPTFTHES